MTIKKENNILTFVFEADKNDGISFYTAKRNQGGVDDICLIITETSTSIEKSIKDVKNGLQVAGDKTVIFKFDNPQALDLLAQSLNFIKKTNFKSELNLKRFKIISENSKDKIEKKRKFFFED